MELRRIISKHKVKNKESIKKTWNWIDSVVEEFPWVGILFPAAGMTKFSATKEFLIKATVIYET